MKISISYWGLEGGSEAKKPIEEAMQEAKAFGFDAIELAISGSGVLTPETTLKKCQEIVDHAKRIGIEISSLASGESWAYSPTSSNPAVRQKIIEFTSPRKLFKSLAGWDWMPIYTYRAQWICFLIRMGKLCLMMFVIPERSSL